MLTQDQKDQVIQLLKKYPVPIPDKPVHDLSDKLKIDTDELESYIYGLAQVAITEKIPGGLADGKSPADFDPQAIAKGIKVELEHTDDKDMAREIAMDHLTEDPKYYEKLERMESGKRVAARYLQARSEVKEIRTLDRLVKTIGTVARDALKYITDAPDDPIQIEWYDQLSKQLEEGILDLRFLSDKIPGLQAEVKRKLHEEYAENQREKGFQGPNFKRHAPIPGNRR